MLMDNHSERPAPDDQPLPPQPQVISNAGALEPQQAKKANISISDADAQALLAIHNLQSSGNTQKNNKVHIGLIVTVIALVILALFASYMLNGLKVGNNAKSPANNAAQSSSGSSSDTTTNQINQDVHSCSNVTTAVSEC